MIALYLWVNALFYVVFAALCALRPAATSKSIGFLSLNQGGLTEYLTVYGGMEFGLGLMFAWMALRPELHRVGLVVALLIYGPIVLFRWINVIRLWPVPTITLATGALEATLFLVALVLWWISRQAAM